ncbi:MAG: S-layer homology domain-containing protein [Eubacteriales bacterium]|nr:S-layer homology domain-containing protein [Eubacteriales bacterium]
MGIKLSKIRKQLSILIILCMLASLPIVTGPVFAAEEESGVKITCVPSILWGGYGRYVEYEMDGVKYRTDEAPSAVNREAWNRMSDEDRRTTYKTLYTATARKAAFGENGYAYIKHWTNQSGEWYEANKIWKERVAKRTFPELQPIFNAEVSLSDLYSDYDDLKNYVIPINIPTNNSDRKAFQEAKDALEQHFAIGKEYYQKAVDMRAKSIGTAVSFTVVQCTQMLTDMLFVPSVVQGATVATSGMIADVTNVLLQVVGADGGSLVEKLGIVLDGGTAHLTVGEQVHLYASYIKTYAKLAEHSKADMDTKMGELRAARDNLNSLSETLLAEEQEKTSKKEAEQAIYEQSIEETFVTPAAIEPGEGDDVYITLVFKWKTEAELKKDLFKNNFDQWLQDNSTEDSFAYSKASELIFDEVIAQKSILDHEVTEKVNIISDIFMEAYNSANGKIEASESTLSTLKDELKDKLPEDYKYNEAALYRIPVGGSFFYGTDSFRPELENYYDGQPYDSFYEQLETHISDCKIKVEAMLKDVESLKSSSKELYNSIEIDVQNVIFYLNLLESLEENYLSMYNSVVWELHNDPDGEDKSVNYKNNPYYINPINSEAGEAYRINGFSEALTEANLPEEVYDPKVTIDEFAEALTITRPTDIFDEAYTIYLELSDVSEILARAYDDCEYNEKAFQDGRTSYYEEMDKWLAEYETAQQKMANAFAEIKNITDSYKSLWEGTYFRGAYDIYGYNPYLYNTELVSLSAFDIAGLRTYINSGGNTATLYNKLTEIERKAEIYEVDTRELIGKIGALDIEMQQLRNTTLYNYAESKGTLVKTFYSLRQEFGLDHKWDNLTRDAGDALYYFNICDIPQICDILKGETDDVLFLRNSIKEIRGYLDADTVDTIPVSNRLYDIYKKATGVKDIYMGSAYENYGLLTEEQHTNLMNLYANPWDGDDILNTVNSVKQKHEGIDYTYPPSQHEGVDEYTPVGAPTYTASAPGSIAVQTPIYHPVAVNTRSLNATLFIYDDEWNKVQTLILTEDELQGIIDTESDMVKIPFADLEDGREYRLDWKITYGTGLTDYEEGGYYFTYTSPVGVFTTVELNEETYDSANVTVNNNSGINLNDQYIFLNGYDYEENILISLIKPLGNLNSGETVSCEFTFDEAVYSAEAYVADEGGQMEAVPVRLEIEGGDSFVEVPSSFAETNSLTFTATVYDQYGEVYEGGSIAWSITPEIDGITIDDGVVTVTSAARDEAIESGFLQCTVTATLSGEGVSGSANVIVKPGNAVASQVKFKRGSQILTGGDTDVIPIPSDEESIYTYSAVLTDQYGVEMDSDPDDFTWSTTGTVSGVTVNNNQITITKDAETDSLNLSVTHTESGSASEITINIVDLSIDWNGVEEKITSTEYIYGDRNDKAGELGGGIATCGDFKFSGSFSYKDPDAIQDAGNQKITVIFTVSSGDYQGLRIERDVEITVAKRAITVTANDKSKAYGEDNPPLTFSLTSGSLVGSDTTKDLGITLSCEAGTSDSAGTAAAITGVSDSVNYEITVQEGRLTITKAALTGTLSITGSAEAGETLVADFLSDVDALDYDIIWISGGNQVATSSEYTVSDSDKGKTLIAKAVGKGNYEGEVLSDAISIPSDASEPTKPGKGGGSTPIEPLPEQEEKDIVIETTTGTTTTSVVDREKLESYVETAEKGSGILIPISENKIATAQLPLNTFEIMAEKEMTLTILSGPVAVDVPSTSIDTDAIKGLLGAEGSDADISLSITIAQPSSDETASLHTAAESEGLEMLGTPVVFNITASYNGETVVIASFKQYVQRRLEVSKETAENVTTAVVFEADNTFRPVPTSVYLEGGKYYVIVSTRTNSTYVLVSQKTAFNDTDGKWYKDIVKEMADRQIIRGIGNNVFAGDRGITRAEFAAIMIRALGLPAKGTSQFSDVAADSWYNQAVAAAAQYGIVSGKGDNRFDPLAKITREEAMQIVFNASKLVPINGAEASVDNKAYSDYDAKSQWATEAVDFNLNNGLIVGSNGKINPKANITRGEAATVILKLLQKANLVNGRTD